MKRRYPIRSTTAVLAAVLAGTAGVSFVAATNPIEAHSPVKPPASVASAVLPASEVTTAVPLAEHAEALAPIAEQAAVAPVEQAKAALPKIDRDERDRLADELARWVTRHPRQLVDVIANLAEAQPLPVPPTYLLSIAWSETRGKILAVSPAGAAGLAQATPAAYLLEGFDGKLYVTTDYLAGTRAYIVKKPLGDALMISDLLLKRNTAETRDQARALTARAMELRREGFDELEALRPVANDTFFRRIDEGDAHNRTTLQELEQIIDRGARRSEVTQFRTRVQRDYTYLRNLQRTGWDRYARDLSARRDALLQGKYGENASAVITARPYEAGQYLGEVLDARFSPEQMAEFLAVHLATKRQQARDLGVADEKLDAWTAALYNGGAVNIKRMQAGLIDRLRETQKYMQAVPARMKMLDRSLG